MHFPVELIVESELQPDGTWLDTYEPFVVCGCDLAQCYPYGVGVHVEPVEL